MEGWPATEASVALAERVADDTSTGAAARGRRRRARRSHHRERVRWREPDPSPSSTAPTRNPWDPERTPAARRAGRRRPSPAGMVTLATAGDGGGSIRIPAAFSGLLGLKSTYGRIPRGPSVGPATSPPCRGCLSRSVRDIARYLDVTNGFDPRDPRSLPRVEGWEARSAPATCAGRVVISPISATAVVDAGGRRPSSGAPRRSSRPPGSAGRHRRAGARTGSAWGSRRLAGIATDLGDRVARVRRRPHPADRVRSEMAEQQYDAARSHRGRGRRIEMNEAMADLFDQVDFVLTSTDPDVAFGDEGPFPTVFNGVEAGPATTARSRSRPTSTATPRSRYRRAPPRPARRAASAAPHHQEPVLLDLALAVERERPWPLVAPGRTDLSRRWSGAAPTPSCRRHLLHHRARLVTHRRSPVRAVRLVVLGADRFEDAHATLNAPILSRDTGERRFCATGLSVLCPA